MDPLLPEVAWSWLVDALADRSEHVTALGGTVTATTSVRYGDIWAAACPPARAAGLVDGHHPGFGLHAGVLRGSRACGRAAPVGVTDLSVHVHAPDMPEADTDTPDHPAGGPPPVPLACPSKAFRTCPSRPTRSQGPQTHWRAAAVRGRRRARLRLPVPNRAYLIQIRRSGAGTVLIDRSTTAAAHWTCLKPVADVLSQDEWIPHAADQDLPCLAEVGLAPPSLYDTEPAGRLAGFEQVNLAAMVERLLGQASPKPQGGRLVPAPTARSPAELRGPSTSREVLIELRSAIAGVLADQDQAPGPRRNSGIPALRGGSPTRRDRWRRTSASTRSAPMKGASGGARVVDGAGPHRPQPRHRAGRILPDSAIVAAAATRRPSRSYWPLPVFGGNKQCRSAKVWSALAAARSGDRPSDRADRRASSAGALGQTQAGSRCAAGRGPGRAG